MMTQTNRCLMSHVWCGWCVAALVFFCGTAVDGQTNPLTWKLAKGDQFEFRLEQATLATTNVASRIKTNEGSTTLVMSWDVVAVAENGDATIEQSLSSIKIATGNPEVPSQAVAYDTSSDQKISKVSQRLMDQVMPLIGMKFQIVMSRRGEIKQVTLPPESTEKINQLPDTMQLRSLFSESGLKELQGASAIVLPDESLSPGDSWSVEHRTPTPFGTFNRIRTYTFVGEATIEGRQLAEFTLVTTMEPEENADADGPATNVLTQEGTLQGKLVSSTGSGKLLMDVEDGYLASSVIEHDAQTEKPYREKLIETTVTNKVVMTVTRK